MTFVVLVPMQAGGDQLNLILSLPTTEVLKLLTGGETNRAIIRRLAKFLNFYGGVCILDSLSQGRILDLLERELTVLINTSPEVAAPSAP